MRVMPLLAVLVLTIVIMVAIMFTSVALQSADPTPTPYPTVVPLALNPNEAVTPPLVTQVAEYAARAEAAAEDALKAADEVNVQVNTQLDTANMLLGLFQNVTAISGIIIPLLAALAGYYGINRLNELQTQVEDARARFEKDINQKQAELDNLRKELEATAEVQRDSTAKANLALSFLALGDRQYRSQDFAGALDTFRQALELDPDSLITHYRLGYVYTQSGNLDLAETHLTRALEIKSDFAPALAALGYVYRRIGEKMPS
ncbi:MAG: tetratricopeptide repeat protein, partial [Anaerolineae bacterium]|nr:tetratricopeptide repeat protein [Anaerolineae bacterium]